MADMTEHACRFDWLVSDSIHIDPPCSIHKGGHSWVCDLGLSAIRRQLDEQRVHMEAWYKVFGTTQLTHAQASLDAWNDEHKRLLIRLDEQERAMRRLRGALEEGVVRHLELDRWTLERVEADPGAYIHVIRKALSPVMEPPT